MTRRPDRWTERPEDWEAAEVQAAEWTRFVAVFDEGTLTYNRGGRNTEKDNGEWLITWSDGYACLQYV